jgi:hypothetical protein
MTVYLVGIGDGWSGAGKPSRICHSCLPNGRESLADAIRAIRKAGNDRPQ